MKLTIFERPIEKPRRKLKTKPRHILLNGRARLNPDAPLLAQIRGML